MTRKSLQVLFCVAAAAVFGAYGTAAQAIAYDVGFDPFGDQNDIFIDVPPTCFLPFPGDNGCAFDVTGGSFTDGLGRLWDISGRNRNRSVHQRRRQRPPHRHPGQLLVTSARRF